MTDPGPKLSDSIAQLQGHSLDYGAKCRNACYSGVAAGWALHSSNNLNAFFFATAAAFFLSSLAVDISISSGGVNLLMHKIVNAQRQGKDYIEYTSEEAVKFAERSSYMQWLVLAGFTTLAVGFLVSALHIHVHFCK